MGEAVKSKPWTCDVCGKPIRGATGYVTIADRDGGYPARHERPAIAPGPLTLGERLTRGEVQLQSDIAIRAMHADCDPNPNTGEYWLGVERAQTLEAWVAWAAHLADKCWMGELEIKSFLGFWFTNRGVSNWRGLS
jgi:hypothetical protein